MMSQTLRNLLYLFSFFMFFSNHCLAGIEPYENFIKGQIKKNDTLFVKDEKFKNPLFNWADITNISVQNTVSLRIVDEQVISRDFSCRMTIKIEYFSTPGQTQAILIDSVKLNVNYSRQSGAVYQNVDLYKFTNGYYVKITVSDISSPEFGSQLPPILQLSSHIVIDRKYLFKPFMPLLLNGELVSSGSRNAMMRLSSGTPKNYNNQLDLTWTLVSGAEEFDLEWVAVDEDSEWWELASHMKTNTGVITDDQMNAMFKNNATRITTVENNYLISLLYNAKYIAVRMRQVHYNSLGIRIGAPWYYKLDNSNDYAIWSLDWHEPALNWQYSAAFAEEGKKKEVVSYFDGTLRSRQTVTLNNSDNVAVVQETVYDQFGRPAASILPAPIKEEGLSTQYLHYFRGFNKNNNGNPYSFANLSTDCEPVPQPLSTISGASQYYSSGNQFIQSGQPDVKKYNKYIPDAEGYPLSITQYTSDNTGKIKLQGGVGLTFQPRTSGLSKTTKYYYGKPAQWELDQLFGSDVGYAEHYLKNMVVDPNGQISISYLNAGGKTIATALTGISPENVDTLSSSVGAKYQMNTLLKPEEFNFDATSLKLKATTTFLASVTGIDTIRYDIEKLISHYPGTGIFQPCSNCYYDLTIKVYNDCGISVLPPITNAVKIGSEISNCNDNGIYQNSFTLNIDRIGAYYITFEFELSKKVIENFTNDFIAGGQQSGVIKKRQEFVLKFLETANFKDCFSDCKTARAKLGTEAAFKSMFNKKLFTLGEDSLYYAMYIQGLYVSLSDTISVLEQSCITAPVSPCEIYRNPMLGDVSPGGQYAMVDSLGNLLELSTNVIATYLHNGAFNVKTSADPLYGPSLITKDDGSEVSPYDSSFTPADIVKYWKPEWAEQFLPFHPEYCKLIFCNDNTTSAFWDQKVAAIEKKSDVPVGLNTSSFNNTNPTFLLSIDPFFQTGGAGHLYVDSIAADLIHYSRHVMYLDNIIEKNINQVVDFQLYCSDVTGTTNQSINTDNWANCLPVVDCRVEDREWQLYRDMYLDLKSLYFQKVRSKTTCLNNCNIGTAVSLPVNPNTSCSQITLGFTGQQLSSNQFREARSGAPGWTNYTFISGTANNPPEVSNYCTSNFPFSPYLVFRPCIKVLLPNNPVAVNFYSVWEIVCVQTPYNPCGGTYGELYADNLIGPDTYIVSSEGVTSTYTMYLGRTAVDVPANQCDGFGTTDFYDCFTVYLDGQPALLNNVWINVCTTFGALPEPTVSALKENITANEGSAEAILTEINSEKSEGQIILADYGSKDLYKISKTKVIADSSISNLKKHSKTFFGAYELKPYFKVQIGKRLFKTFKDVYVTSFLPSSGSKKDREKKTIEKIMFNSSAKALATKSSTQNEVSLKSKNVTNQVSLCANIIDEDYGSDRINCMGTNYDNALRRTTVMMLDGNGQPAIAVNDVIIYVNYSHILGNVWATPGTLSSIPIIISSGQSVGYYTYESISYSDEGQSSCFQNQQNFQCVASISGAEFCSPIEGCDGTTLPGLNCPEIYTQKTPRFAEIGSVNVAGIDTASYSIQNRGDLSLQINNAAIGQADGWMSRLKQGLFDISASFENTNLLRAKLIELCIVGGDENHPFGASTLPTVPAEKSIDVNNVPCHSFGEVLKAVFPVELAAGFTNTLNPWLLDGPFPFSPIRQATQVTISNSSSEICSLLNSKNTNGWSPSVFYSHLVSDYGLAMTLSYDDFQVLLKGCNNCKYILSKDIVLPVFLQPGATGCISRAEYLAIKSNLNQKFSSTPLVVWSNYEKILSNYLNFTWGFSFSYNEYKEFEDGVVGQLCNQPAYTSLEEDPYACAEIVIENNFGYGNRDYLSYLEEEKTKFRNAYINTCALAKANVSLSGKQKIYHHTLYYYDMAGNLVRTVPPEGVNILSDVDVSRITLARDFNPDNCSYNGPPIEAIKPVALQSLSNALAYPGNAALELWLYSQDSGSRQMIATTPDMKFLFQACVSSTLVNIDIYSLQQTDAGSVSIILSNHVTADVSAISSLNPWTHIVLQGSNLASGTLQLWVNGKLYPAVSGASSAGCGWIITSNPTLVMPENLATLKHLRVYNGRLLTAQEIKDNAESGCFNASGSYTAWHRFNLPAAGSSTLAENSTVETQYNLLYPAHGLITTYTYNATNQVVQQNSPDGGNSKFWYDYLSRLVFSQNAKQQVANNFSYTSYDILGRVSEVGQKYTTNTSINGKSYLSNTDYRAFLSLGDNSQITQTIYDVQPSGIGVYNNLDQQNFRKRVSASIYRETPSSTAINASYYNYDLAGNVKTLYQQVNGLGLKTLGYEYDLVSGKVNFLSYQAGAADQFYYLYKYDTENRLIDAYSSIAANIDPFGFRSSANETDRKLDAHYQYYLHGPLARTELGKLENKVQALDYVYTLQGWLKGLNGNKLSGGTADVGEDGANNIGKDVLAYSLGYYAGDYKPIGAGAATFNLNYQQSTGDITGLNLYNGNISSSTYSVAGINGGNTVGYTYRYDQLNRLKALRQHNLGSTTEPWTVGSLSTAYKEEFRYDGNGNIKTLNRNAAGGVAMDNLSYTYNLNAATGKLLNNKLMGVSDGISGINNPGELEGTTSYSYDEIGNLIHETKNASPSSTIEWTVYGKISKITQPDGKIITYSYDASGNRVSKLYDGVSTWYVRDAQGNSLGVYGTQETGESAGTYWREQQLYGSSRLGMWKPNVNLATQSGSTYWNDTGLKFFELSNHLGNVMSVINDTRVPVSAGYEATVISAHDYYAFGGLMPGRDYTNPGSKAYRYGFNGKENDNEVKGTGNQQDYGMRIYDPRIGKFLSMDPLTSQYPSLTPYQFASNSPMANTDLDGLEANIAIYGRGGENTGYKSSDILSFRKRANDLKKVGFNSVSVNNGVSLVNQLKSATKSEGSISAIVSFTHSSSNGIFLDNDAGFYTGSASRSSSLSSNVNSVSELVESGDIKFTKNAIWIFASCNTGNSNDPGWQEASNLGRELARNTAINLNIETIGARGFVGPELINGKETGRLIAGNAHGSNIDDLGFIKFTPVTTIVKMRSLADFIFGRPGKDIEIPTGEIKQEKLGTVINPVDFVPKKK